FLSRREDHLVLNRITLIEFPGNVWSQRLLASSIVTCLGTMFIGASIELVSSGLPTITCAVAFFRTLAPASSTVMAWSVSKTLTTLRMMSPETACLLAEAKSGSFGFGGGGARKRPPPGRVVAVGV